MWGHAHGMVQLYHQGRLATDADGFRALFEESAARVMAGIATESFAAELTAATEPGDTPAAATLQPTI
jgi:hypothetical protein